MKHKSILSFLVIFAWLISAPILFAADTAEIETTLEEMESQSGDQYWQSVQALKKKAGAATEVLRGTMNDGSVSAQIASAYILFQQGQEIPVGEDPDRKTALKTESIETLVSILEQDHARSRHLKAADALYMSMVDTTLNERVDDFRDRLEVVLSKTEDDLLSVRIARGLNALTGYSLRAVNTLRDLTGSDNKVAQFEAAEALVELDEYEAAKPVLDQYRNLPTERGKRAQELLDRVQLYQDVQQLQREQTDDDQESSDDSGSSDASSGDVNDKKEKLHNVMDEILGLIDNEYVDPSRVNYDELIDGAATGMLDQLDRDTSYLDEEQLQSLREDVDRDYAGIGAIVTMRDGWLTIEQPIYSGPAYNAGLRSGDRITSVEGESTQGRNVGELTEIIKGEPGTEVTITVMRRGWQEERDFTIERADIDMSTVHHRLLPGNVGYIQIVSFGQETPEELRSAIQELRDQGMESMMIDLRNNTGGYLSAARVVVDYFLEEGKEILSIRGADEDQTIYSRGPKIYDGPLAVLINGGSASASEITAGVIKDYDLGTVIGTRSFGKGSVQNLFELESTDENTGIRLTRAEYFLPSGKNVHRPHEDTPEDAEWGIRPNIEIEPEQNDLWVAYAAGQLREENALQEYIDANMEEHRDTFLELAKFDGGEWENYPNFDPFYKDLDTRMTRDQVREVLRNAIRRRMADVREQAFRVDYQRDRQLQRAILLLLNENGQDPSDIQEYKYFLGYFQE